MMEGTINAMSKQELIENIAQALLVIKNRKGIKGDSKRLLKEFLWKLRGTKEYQEYSMVAVQDTDWSVMPGFEESSTLDRAAKRYLERNMKVVKKPRI